MRDPLLPWHQGASERRDQPEAERSRPASLTRAGRRQVRGKRQQLRIWMTKKAPMPKRPFKTVTLAWFHLVQPSESTEPCRAQPEREATHSCQTRTRLLAAGSCAASEQGWLHCAPVGPPRYPGADSRNSPAWALAGPRCSLPAIIVTQHADVHVCLCVHNHPPWAPLAQTLRSPSIPFPSARPASGPPRQS